MTHRQRAQLLRELVTIKDRLRSKQHDVDCIRETVADMNRRDEIERLLIGSSK